MRTRIKMCGITNPGDATDALDAGADYLGLVFTESPRHVSLEDARRIRAAVPATTPLVGVFADETPDLVLPIASALGLAAIQVRGWLDQSEPPGLEVWHVIRGETLPEPTSLPMIPLRTYHLDAHDPARAGGTGQVTDWDWAKLAVESGLRVFVAGGLTAENVDRLVLDVRPFGVDASSGLESTVGRKSGERMRAFVERVRASDRARPKRS